MDAFGLNALSVRVAYLLVILLPATTVDKKPSNARQLSQRAPNVMVDVSPSVIASSA
jgi:hypothetical protein